MTRSPVAILCLILVTLFSALPAAQTAPLRIFLRGGPKTHGPVGNGLHDGEVWVREWVPLLQSRGATVEGAIRFPTGEELARTDVLVMFAADAGTILGADRANLEAFLKRGGGIVCLHDCVVTSQDPQWFKTIVGGSWENRVAKYFEGENTYYYVSPEHPVVKGAANFTLTDEVYWDLHMMPNVQVLASSMQPVRPAAGATADASIRTLIPQMWAYERQVDGGVPYRAFVSLLGHHFTTFSSPHVRAVFLRAIAWAGKRDVDLLATPDEVRAIR
ncbi:MAG: ThuA domain-containing protein [Acidobacteriota bacterium]